MFKLEFPAENKSLAAAIGRALLEYGTGAIGAELRTVVVPFDKPLVEETAAEVQDVETAVTETALSVNEAAVADVGKSTQSTAEHGVGAAQGATDVKVDSHGVPFDSDYCANAADPFYKTGKTAGQWKKKKGVDQDEYDDWYAAAKPAAGTSTSTAADTAIDTTAAFSGQQQAATNTGVPADAGAFMVWVSEMTTAGHFTQADVTSAYGVVGIGAADIFQGGNEAQNIASLHGVLSAKVPA